MSIQKRDMAPGETFQVPFEIGVAASTLRYSFEVAGGGTVEFSVFHLKQSKPETLLLSPTTFTLDTGAIKDLGPGVVMLRFHNPKGWVFSSTIQLAYSLDLEAPASRKAAAPKSRERKGSYEAKLTTAVDEALAKALQGPPIAAKSSSRHGAAKAPAAAAAAAAAPARAAAPAAAPAPAPAAAPVPRPPASLAPAPAATPAAATAAATSKASTGAATAAAPPRPASAKPLTADDPEPNPAAEVARKALHDVARSTLEVSDRIMRTSSAAMAAVPSTRASASAPAAVPSPASALPLLPASTGSLPASLLDLLDELGLGKYKKRFSKEDFTETSMLVAYLALPQGAADLRGVLGQDLGMSVGHREKLMLALTSE